MNSSLIRINAPNWIFVKNYKKVKSFITKKKHKFIIHTYVTVVSHPSCYTSGFTFAICWRTSSISAIAAAWADLYTVWAIKFIRTFWKEKVQSLVMHFVPKSVSNAKSHKGQCFKWTQSNIIYSDYKWDIRWYNSIMSQLYFMRGING